VTANLRACVDADGRTQQAIASAAWPELAPAAALQRLYRALAGAWPSAETATALGLGLRVDPAIFYA
jgi:hypothetical protein